MTSGVPKPVFWMDSTAPSPVCDVPWVGRTIIEPTGGLRFCCFSSGIVGNINTHSFEELWNGKEMRRIRQELVDQRLPIECQTAACPIYRGDKFNYIVRRLDELQIPKDFTQLVRSNLDGTLRIHSSKASGRYAIDIEIELNPFDIICTADLVLGVRSPDGRQVFWPDFDEFPVPMYPGLPLESRSHIRLKPVTGDTEHFDQRGVYEVSAALFHLNSDLNFLANCYWSDSVTITLE